VGAKRSKAKRDHGLLIPKQETFTVPTNIASCRAAGAAIAMALTFSVGAQVANTTATSQFGAWGYDGTGADKSTKPGNDFFGFANGTWLDHT